ncbi:MAG: hypothetical protein KME09_06715 [Pleurocapsa minor HA4230-MV1]|jgi:hypothetical protein|nr:hypothetical protein [Pleurocapsa minor HA4230-MV1]
MTILSTTCTGERRRGANPLGQMSVNLHVVPLWYTQEPLTLYSYKCLTVYLSYSKNSEQLL